MYKRYQFNVLKERLHEPRRFIQAIVGPRQIGKSTMVKQVLDEIHKIDDWSNQVEREWNSDTFHDVNLNISPDKLFL